MKIGSRFDLTTGGGGGTGLRLNITGNSGPGSFFEPGDTLSVLDDSVITKDIADNESIQWTVDGGSAQIQDTLVTASGDDVVLAEWGPLSKTFSLSDGAITVVGLSAVKLEYGATIDIDITAGFEGANLSYSLVSGPAWLADDGDGTLSGTVPSTDVAATTVTVRASNNVDAKPTTFDISVSDIVLPDLEIYDFEFIDGNAELGVNYTGEAALTVYGATGTDPIMSGLTDDEKRTILKAGSGGTGTIEFFNFGLTPPTDIDTLSSLTAASNVADRMLIYVEDANGVQSDPVETEVSGLSFGLTKTYLGEFSTIGAASPTGEYTFTGITHGSGTMYAAITTFDEGVSSNLEPDAVTLAGVAASIVTDGTTDASNNPGAHISASVWSAEVTAGTSSIMVDCGADLGEGLAVRLYLIEGEHTVQDVVQVPPAYPMVGDVNTTTGGFVIFTGQIRASAGTKTTTYTGVSQDGSKIDLNAGDVSWCASAEVETGETPRNVEVLFNSPGSNPTAVSVSLAPGS